MCLLLYLSDAYEPDLSHRMAIGDGAFSRHHRGLAEILELSAELIRRWRAPLLDYQRQFVVRSLGENNRTPEQTVIKHPHYNVIIWGDA